MMKLLLLAMAVTGWRVTMSGGCGQRLNSDFESDPAELPNKTPGPDFDGPLFEVVDAKILMGGAIFQHVVDRCEQRGGDGGGGDLLASLAAYPMEQRPIVAVFFA